MEKHCPFMNMECIGQACVLWNDEFNERLVVNRLEALDTLVEDGNKIARLLSRMEDDHD